MRILWISSWNTGRHTGGIGTYSRGILALLRLAFPGAQIACVEPEGEDGSIRRARQSAAVLRSMASHHSAKWHFDRAVTEVELRQALGGSPPDLVLVIGIAAGALLHGLPRAMPRVLVAASVETAAYQAQLDRSPAATRLLLRGLLRDVEKHRRAEHEVLSGIDACIAVSEDIALGMAAIASRTIPMLVVPPLFPAADRGREPVSAGGGIRLGFVGRFSWWPNREAMEWFLREIWPAAGREGVELHVYGEGSAVYENRSMRVFGHGYEPDAHALWAAFDVFVNPMRSSTGVNVKVCEAIHRGLPVLGTREGLQGLDLSGDPAIVVCGSREQWLERLQPDSLTAFRERVPSEATRRAMEPERHVDGVRSFLHRISPSLPCPPAASSA